MCVGLIVDKTLPPVTKVMRGWKVFSVKRGQCFSPVWRNKWTVNVWKKAIGRADNVNAGFYIFSNKQAAAKWMSSDQYWRLHLVLRPVEFKSVKNIRTNLPHRGYIYVARWCRLVK